MEECPKTREMLQKLGFTTIEEIQIPVDDKGDVYKRQQYGDRCLRFAMIDGSLEV